jgi:hypothetical protein
MEEAVDRFSISLNDLILGFHRDSSEPIVRLGHKVAGGKGRQHESYQHMREGGARSL